MTQISERYARLADAFAEKIAAVSDDKWSAQTPCPDWSARELVRHVVDTQAMFLGFVDRRPEPGPSVDTDPVGAFAAIRAVMQQALEDPEGAKAEFDGFAGRSTLESGVDRFLCTDLVVHAWDLARATGQDEAIDRAELEKVRVLAESFGEAARSPQAFGPLVEAPADADEQTKTLAFLGRKA